MNYEGIRLKLNKLSRDAFAGIRRKQLHNTEFTIISNNCWGGAIYESYGVVKQSPTVGAFFMADDYLRLITNLKDYLDNKLEFIEPEQSKYAKQLEKDPKFGTYPVGLLGDVEIMFMHYHSDSEALEKWERRCSRINWDKMIFKFNDQNGCMEKHVKEFASLPYKNKLFFTIKDWPVEKWDGYCKIKQYTNEKCITASHEPFGTNRYINLTEILNNL